jgi:hypothetical protein
MGADASIWLAIGLALPFAGAVAVVALCRMALLQRAEVKVEIEAPSLRLKFQARFPDPNPKGEVGEPVRREGPPGTTRARPFGPE